MPEEPYIPESPYIPEKQNPPGNPYLDSGFQSGLSNSELFQLRLENMNNFYKIMGQKPHLSGQFDFYRQDTNAQFRVSETDKILQDIESGRTDFSDYLGHPDKKIRDIANEIVQKKAENDPFYKNNVGGVEVMPYDKSMEKFLSKDFGYRPDRDNEDYYYRNVYMQDGFFLRNFIKNPIRFLGRVAGQSILKLGQGAGYLLSMVGSIGSDNYWADVADNGLSSWLEEKEQDFKDKLIPVYKEAGFDEKGFFSKLVDWSFWNDSVADGVAFMVSAAIPATGIAKLGTLGKFGQAFSTTSTLGKLANKVGMGSWAQLSAWTLNTAMESSQEGAQIFKEMKRRLELERAEGKNELSDEDIKERAGKLAANTVMGNFGILSLSNAFENTLFFKPFKQVSGRASVGLGEDFMASSKMRGTGRLSFYGSRATQASLAEGLWEENAQLALQRYYQGDAQDRNFFQQLGKQTIDALQGDDKEAAESIFIGSLIGSGASGLFEKIANERKNTIKNTLKTIEEANAIRSNLFSTTDIYERDSDGNILFDGNTPRADAKKLATKVKELARLYDDLSLTNSDDYYNSYATQYQAKKALADFVGALSEIKVKGVSERMKSINPQYATLFGMNPSEIKEQTKDFASLAETFEKIHKDVKKLSKGIRPANVSDIDYLTNEFQRKIAIYEKKASKAILNGFVAEETTKWLNSLNRVRNLNNSSISQFPVDQLNTLIYQKNLNKEIINSPEFQEMSDFEKQYHLDRDQSLSNQINNYKKNNESFLEDTKLSPEGYYIPLIKNEDGTFTEVETDPISLNSQLKIADYNNIIDKNDWISNKLSDKDGYENFQKLRETPLIKSLKELEKKVLNEDRKSKNESNNEVRNEVRDETFYKILEHVKRSLFSENYTPSAEISEIIKNNPDLTERLTKEYKNSAEKARKHILNKRLESLRSLQNTLKNQVSSYTSRIQDKKIELEILREEMEMIENKKPVDQKRLAKAINKLDEDIKEVEEWYNKQIFRINELDNQISVLEQEIESGDLKGLRNSLEEVHKERNYVNRKIEETKLLVDRLKKLVRDIRQIAYKLFGSKSEFERNLNKHRWEAVEYAIEIEKQIDARDEAKKLLIELNSLSSEIEDKYNTNKKEIEDIIDYTNQLVREQYNIISGKPSKVNVEESTIEKGLTSDKKAFPNGIESKGEKFDEKEGFDGSTYQRPLSTKFYTTTFPWIGEEGNFKKMSEAPQDVQDHAHFLDFITSPSNSKDIQKKLEKGNLRVLTVTRNNVEKLGLQDLLSERKKYFKIEDPALTHIEVIPVIEEGGYLYYIDKELNKVGKVGEDKPNNMVRRSLRTAKFTQEEIDQYSVKYSQDDMNSAIEEATEWRRKILAITEKEPKHFYEFSITRGIPNKMRMEDKNPAKNSVVGTIIPKNLTNAQTVRVFAKENQLINGENIIVPVGRPFIYTTNNLPENKGRHEQLHPADNQPLSSTQVSVVSRVFEEMLYDHLSKVQERINASTTFPKNLKVAIENSGGITNLDPKLKREVFLKVTSDPSTKGFNLFNSNYTNFLSGIVYATFRKPSDDKEIGKNQIYLNGTKLIFGLNGPSIDITNPKDIYKEEIQNFLNSQNHNVKYFTNPERANFEFIEYFQNEKGELKSRIWKNYSEYLISPTFPDNKTREEIPITTAIKTKEQKNAENNSEPYYLYESRAISIHVDTNPTSFSKITTSQEKDIKPKKTGEKSLSEFVTDEIYASYGLKNKPVKEKKPEKIKEEENKPVSLEDTVTNLIYTSYGIPQKEGKPKETSEPIDDIPDYSDDPELPPSAYEGNFRISKTGLFEKEEDLDLVIADIKRMTPQFNVIRLKNVIQTLEGIEAWGQFVNNSIYLYEIAEKGTGYHEVFEGVANRLLSDVEWKSIYKEFNNRTGYFIERVSGNSIKYSEATFHQAKEQIAEEFVNFKLNGVKPPSSNQKVFFQVIWDFLKWLIGAHSYRKIEDIFSMIDKGKFSKRKLRSSDRFINNFKIKILKDLPVAVKRDLYEGATSFMFQNFFYSAKSIVQLDEISLTDEQIYEPIRYQFQQEMIRATADAQRQTDEKEKKKIEKSVQYIKYALDNWSEFVRGHKESIKHLRIKFEEIDNVSDEEKNNQNKNDYVNDVFKYDGKRSASKSVRFLFHTLLKMHFNKEGKTVDINGVTAGLPIRDRSSVYMASLINYDSFMLEALEELQGISDFSQIKRKMRDLSGITEIEEMKNPEKRTELIASLSKDKATWTALYGRLFGFSDKITQEASLNLQIKFNSYINKHSPESYVFVNGGGTSTIVSATKLPYLESIIRKINDSILRNKSVVFTTMMQGNLKMLVPNSDFANVKKIGDEIKIFPKTITAKDFIQGITKQFPLGKRFDNFVKFLGLDDIITSDFIRGLSRSEISQLIDKLLTIRNALTKVTTESKDLSIKSLNIFGYTNNLVDFLDRKMKISKTESQIMGITGTPKQRFILPSFVSRVISEINNVSNIKELHERYPQTSTLFAKDSILLEKMFDEDGNRKPDFSISLGYMDGVKDFEEGEGTSTSKLEFSDRYYLQFNSSLSGIYYSLPADSETEWVFNFGEFVSYTDNILKERGEEIINRIFLPKLKSEIDIVIADQSRLFQLNQKHPSSTKEGAGSTIGKSLRFFKDILQYTEKGKDSKKLLNDIYNSINKGLSSEDIISNSNLRERIINAIGYYLQYETIDTINTLKENRLLQEEGSLFKINGLNGSFLEKNSSSFNQEDGHVMLTSDQLNSLVQYQKINTIIANMEAFKVIFGDPAQYKDFDKRAKSLFSPVEKAFVDSDGKMNKWLNENKNNVVLGEESVSIPDNDIFYNYFSDYITSRTIEDWEVTNVNTVNDLVSLNSNFVRRYIDQYEKSNEADGQSIATIQFGRELFIKSGWRWTTEHENYFQYDGALMRRDLSKSGEYNYPNDELKNIDDKIINYYSENIPRIAITPVKTLMPSVDENGNQILLKHSVHFISYQIAKEFELLDLYKDMLKRRDNIINFRSAQKVGLEIDNNNQITNYYGKSQITKDGKPLLDKEGKQVYGDNPFVKNDLITNGNVQQQLHFKDIGIQVETQSGKKGQTIGSQLTKLSNLNLFEDGVPTDFKEEGLSKSEISEKWENMDEKSRMEISENYRKVYGERGTVTTLENLKTKNTIEKFNELGIKWKWDPVIGFSTSINNLKKIREYILSELQRLEIDQNTIDNLDLSDDGKAFLNSAETTPSYTTISNLLWSIIDKSITSFEVNGKSLVQVSSAFFNKNSRKAAVKNEDGTWIILNTKEEYDLAISQGKKPVMTSSELDFYRIGKDGKTIGMEVYLPDVYKVKLNKERKKRGLEPVTDEELMNYLNKNPKLLEGIGFRIPTQATSSLEFFRIKGFLPEAFGSAIVVPSAITTKAGSDFDVDKLNTYLNNWKIGKNGMPVYEEYVTKEEEYLHNYETSFLPNNTLLKYIQRETKRQKIDEASNTLINKIFGTNTDIMDDVALKIFNEKNFPETYTLQNLIDDAKNELENVNMTFEEYMKLPDFMRQSKGALENRYFDSIRKVLESSEMFEYLLSPNSINHIKKNRDYVYEALGIEAEDKKELDYTRYLSTEYIANKRHAFITGKYNIGIFAVAMTNFANSQITGIGINEEGGIKKSDSYVFDELNNGDITLPFSDIKMLNIGGKFIIPISSLQDSSGELTMDKLSSYINGAVDVAKDPFIVEMGMHGELAGVYILMERMRLTGETTALFMYQPVVREFLRELIFLERKSYFGNSNFKSQKEIIEFLVKKYGGEGRKFDPDYKFTNQELRDLIRKGEKVKKGEAEWTDSELNAQYQALVNFLKMRIFSQHLLETIQGSNHDTASIRSPYIITKKDLQMERSMKGNVIVKATFSNILNGTETIRNKTSIGTDVQLFKTFNTVLSQMNLFALQKENPRKVLDEIARRIILNNSFISNDDFISIMKEYESAIIDILSNNVLIPSLNDGKVEYNRLYEYGKRYFKTNSPESIRNKFEILKAKYPATVKRNFFLSNLEIVADPDLGIDLLELKDKPNNSEVMKKEMYTEALLELAQYDENKWPELADFYRTIVYSSFIQFGIRYSRKSFVDLLPVSAYSKENSQNPVTLTDITRAGLMNIDNENLSYLEELVQRSKYYKNGVVSQRKFMAVQFVAPSYNNPGTYVLENSVKWRSGKSSPPNRISQIFFGRENREGEMQSFIHPIMVWGGYTDDPTKFEDMPTIIAVPAIKPEFLVKKPDSSGYEASPIINSMMKRGNYSFMFIQLFKKVGSQNNSFGRSYISKSKDNRESVNYLYKPIKKFGSRVFNEILPLFITDSGEFMGRESILNFPSFIELEDAELISKIVDRGGKISPITKPQVRSVTVSLKPINEAQLPEEGISSTKEISMTPENIIKIARGTKTTTVRSPKQAGQIGIRVGENDIRLIGGTPYLIKNRGYLTIGEAGGIKNILKSEDVDGEEYLKFKITKDWIKGKGKLFVYDILPAPEQKTDESENLLRDEIIDKFAKNSDLIESLSEISKLMALDNPGEYLKYVAQQYWETMRRIKSLKNEDFFPGEGLDAIPEEIQELAKKAFPESDFISPDNAPPIYPEC